MRSILCLGLILSLLACQDSPDSELIWRRYPSWDGTIILRQKGYEPLGRSLAKCWADREGYDCLLLWDAGYLGIWATRRKYETLNAFDNPAKADGYQCYIISRERAASWNVSHAFFNDKITRNNRDLVMSIRDNNHPVKPISRDLFLQFYPSNGLIGTRVWFDCPTIMRIISEGGMDAIVSRKMKREYLD